MRTRRRIGFGMLGALIVTCAVAAAWVEPKPVLIFEGAIVYCLIAAYLIASGESKS